MKIEITEAENGYIIKRDKYSGAIGALNIAANIKTLCLSKDQLLEEIANIIKTKF